MQYLQLLYYKTFDVSPVNHKHLSGFVDQIDEGQVIHEGYCRKNNAHTKISVTHTQTEQQLSKSFEAVSSVLDDYFKFQGNGVYYDPGQNFLIQKLKIQ